MNGIAEPADADAPVDAAPVTARDVAPDLAATPQADDAAAAATAAAAAAGGNSVLRLSEPATGMSNELVRATARQPATSKAGWSVPVRLTGPSTKRALELDGQTLSDPGSTAAGCAHATNAGMPAAAGPKPFAPVLERLGAGVAAAAASAAAAVRGGVVENVDEAAAAGAVAAGGVAGAVAAAGGAVAVDVVDVEEVVGYVVDGRGMVRRGLGVRGSSEKASAEGVWGGAGRGESRGAYCRFEGC